MSEQTKRRWSVHYATRRSMPSVVAVDEDGFKLGYIAEKVHMDDDAQLIAAAPMMQEAIAGLIANATDSYCEWCRHHAEKDDDGVIVAPIIHSADCPYLFALDALAAARSE